MRTDAAPPADPLPDPPHGAEPGVRPAGGEGTTAPAGEDGGGYVVRRLATLGEYRECIAIQEETWGAGFRERVPTAILLVAQRLGGVCTGAFAPGGRVLGFVFGITGVERGAVVHWSHMLAVRPEARGAGLGERLKRHQRDLVRAAGADTMYWTFDPLVARNAHLNLVRLGARVAEYVPDMYGDGTGSPLHGALATDRLVVAWDLARAAPAAPASPTAAAPAPPPRPDAVLVNPPGPDGGPSLGPLPDAAVVHVAVPGDVEALGPDLRARWRAVTREAFVAYLARGYRVVGFRRGDAGALPRYELARED